MVSSEPRILHIATWYPTPENPHAVPFIKAHFDAVAPFGNHRLVHVEVTPEGSFGLNSHFGRADTSHLRLTGFRGTTRLREWLTLFLLIILRLRLRRKIWDAVVVHVAWPTLRFPKAFRKLFGQNVVLIEHWSAYANNFYLDPDSAAHARMRGMFRADIPIVAVSEGLANDIKAFAKRDDLQTHVIPNVVDSRFRYRSGPRKQSILMAANWNHFRDPFLVMNCFPDLLARHPDLRLTIAGGGSKLESMKAYAEGQVWGEKVTFLGSVSRSRVAEEMRRAAVFAHPTEHETFSVVSAEAMCCGVPAVVSNVGAIPELVIPGATGYTVENNQTAWKDALLKALDSDTVWERQRFAEEGARRFSPKSVGQQIQKVLNELIHR